MRGECSNLAPVSSSISSVSTAFCLVYFLSKKDPVEHTFLPISKSLMKLGYEHQDTYSETFFYTIYRISFSHSCRIEKSAVQVYISPFLFITENENTKKTCERSYETRNKRELRLVYQLHVQ
jgi:hypothetical protein